MKAEVKAEGGNGRDTAKGGNQRGQGRGGNQREPARKLQRVASRLRNDDGGGGEGGGDGGGGEGGEGGGGGGGGEGPCLGFPDDATASPSSPSHGGAHRSYEYMYGGAHIHDTHIARVVGTKRWLTILLTVLYLRP